MVLVEREAVLAQLGSWLAEARAGTGRAVLVGGEAGIGKSSLLRAFVASATQTRVLWGSGEPMAIPEPLGPFREMDALATLLGASRGRTAVLEGLLSELSAAPATIMVVDDAHWADDATIDALRFLGRRIDRITAMLVIAFREEDAPPGSSLRSLLGDLATAPGCRRLGVRPLSREAVQELAATSRMDAARLHAITGGNPFYVSEVLAAPGWSVPPTVTDAVLARVARLDPAAREVVEVTSLEPSGLEPEIALDAAGVAAAVLDGCLERGVLVMTCDRVAFRHELARRAVEGSVAPTRRRRLHLHLLRHLERLGSEDATRLAHHADAAGEATSVVHYDRIAATAASERGAHRVAAGHLARAVGRAGSLAPGDQAALLSAWAGERFRFDRPDELLDLRRRAIDLWRQAGDRRAEARELLELSRLVDWQGDLPMAASLAADALEILEGQGESADLAYAQAGVAYSEGRALRWGAARREARRAIELAGRTDADHLTTVLALRVLGEADVVTGRVAEGLESCELALRAADAAGDFDRVVAVMLDMVAALLTARRYEEARRWAGDALALGEAIDLDSRVAHGRVLMAEIELEAGDWAAAGRLLGHPGGPGHPVTQAEWLVVAARLAVRRGDPGATAHLDEASRLIPSSDIAERWELAATVAEAAWLAGRRSEIPQHIGDLYDRARETGVVWAAIELGYWLWRSGALGHQPPGPPDDPRLLQIAGNWRAAADAWERCGCPYWQAEALADGDEPAMRRALSIFSRLGAEPAADRLRAAMRRAGIAAVPARPRASTRVAPAQLSRRQLEIVGLLMAGLSNREIAGRLYITEKTAEHHVSAILAKFGVRSRAEAVATARKMGIDQAET